MRTLGIINFSPSVLLLTADGHSVWLQGSIGVLTNAKVWFGSLANVQIVKMPEAFEWLLAVNGFYMII